MFYFATESGDHVIVILICDWSVFNVVVVFVCWSCKFCLYFWLLKLFNLFSLFNMSWTDSQIESLITFYSSELVSGARNFATGVKNRRQKPTPVFWRRFLERVSWALAAYSMSDWYDAFMSHQISHWSVHLGARNRKSDRIFKDKILYWRHLASREKVECAYATTNLPHAGSLPSSSLTNFLTTPFLRVSLRPKSQIPLR